jgi:hypothetical protein
MLVAAPACSRCSSPASRGGASACSPSPASARCRSHGSFLKPYQKDRILMFLNPEADPLGAGWNIIQSKIAIGSGGLLGKGWGKGSQAHLDFLPEHTTDFAFSVLSEEWGWIGVSILFALYLFIVGRSLWIAAQCPRRLLAPAGRRSGDDLLGVRAGQRKHGGRAVAGGRRADAAAQLRRYFGGVVAGGLWDHHVGACAPQVHVVKNGVSVLIRARA